MNPLSIHPGSYLQAIMTNNSIPVRVIACRAGLPFETVRRLLICRVRVDAELAVKLEAATDVSADYWLLLQERWDNRLPTPPQ